MTNKGRREKNNALGIKERNSLYILIENWSDFFSVLFNERKGYIVYSNAKLFILVFSLI